jgi:F-type H+-transporting ATPase subunit a
MNSDVLAVKNLFHIKLAGLDIPISDSIVIMWGIMAFLMVGALLLTRNLQTIPRGRQNFVETVVELSNKLIQGNIGHHWKAFAPYFGTVLLFLVVANAIDLISLTFGNFKIVAPTKDLNVTLTLALMTMALVLFSGIRYKGFVGWLKGFLKPIPIMLPFNILDYGTRTLSLSLRLFGNILAGYVILEMLYRGLIYVKLLIPLAAAFFDLFDAFLQAYIFVFLSTIYISEAIEQGGENE